MILQKCQIHSEEECKFICLYPHECQKKLCQLCLDDHNNQISEMQFIEVDNFFLKMNELFNSFYFNSKIDQSQSIIDKSINEIQQLFEKLFQTIKSSLLILFSSLKQYNEEYENLIKILREYNLKKLTNKDLQILTSSQLCTQITQQNKLKKDLANELVIRVNSLEKELKYFSCSIKEKVNRYNVSQEKKLIKKEKMKKVLYQLKGDEQQLEGEEHFGFKHGEYKFKNQFNQLEKAGYYFFDKRDGQWTEDYYRIQSKGEYNKGLKVKEWQYSSYKELIAKQVYDEQGQKQGRWKDIFVNEMFFLNNDMIIAEGSYSAGLRTGQWSYQRKVKEVINFIGGGFYDEEGKKNGFWKDIQENLLMENHQIIWEGSYESGVRIGEWKIFCNFGQSELTFDKMIYIGGGNYANQGLKLGKWREIYGEDDYQNLQNFNILLDDFSHFQIIWQGKYENGLKVGEWKIIQQTNECSIYIGSGNYNSIGQKTGMWREPDINCITKFGFHIFLEGEYSSGVKFGYWKIFHWEGGQEKSNNFSLIGGGVFNNQGQKNGEWEEVEKDIDDEYKIWKGQYQSGIRIGLWKQYYLKFKNNSDNYFSYFCGRGQYNESGKKIKQWIKPSIVGMFWVGSYKEGKNIGKWKLKMNELQKFYKDQIVEFSSLIDFHQSFKVCYDDTGQKIGHWKILQKYENKKLQPQLNLKKEKYFFIQKTKEGEYQNGTKVGEWKIFYRMAFHSQFYQMFVGQYNNKGKKVGLWKNFNISYQKHTNSMRVWIGEYENGIKVGEWKMHQGRWYGTKGEEKMQFEAIAGGKYDKEGLKIGKWQEVEEKFIEQILIKMDEQLDYFLCSRICEEGHYIANKKVGQWRTMLYYSNLRDKITQIGGGLYDETGLKKGWWIEIVENYYQIKRVFWEGKYIAGVRVGKWKLFEEEFDSSQIVLMEGNFNTKGQKIGFWKDIIFKGRKACFIWEGQYKQNIRVGVWKIFYSHNESSSNLLIGGGEFNERGEKSGEWEEINENYYQENFKVSQKGCYKSGRRIGHWKLIFQQNKATLEYHLGNYDEKGEKISLWNDIDENYFKKNKQIINVGFYSHNIKFGRWDIMYNDLNNPNFEIVGGGLYNPQGQKIGIWREIDPNAFSKKIKVLWEGKYLDDIRIGKWKIFCKEQFTQEFEQIGGGEYNDQGIKIGQWKEIKENCYNSKIKITWEGEYQAGVKVGNWNICHKEFNFVYFKTLKFREYEEQNC